MARVNHKKVLRLIAEKRKTITDRQFFVSRVLASHFEDMAMAQTRRYGHSRRVKVRVVWEPKNEDLAHTNNDLIWINAGNKMVTKHRKRQERYDCICGLFTHELGHVLYTDFLVLQTYMTRIAAGTWYPKPPPLATSVEDRNEDEFWAYLKRGGPYQNALIRVALFVSNILEDGYIENKMLDRYPGVLGDSLDYLRELTYEDLPTVSEMVEREEDGEAHIWQSIQNIILQYMKYGKIKYGEEPLSDERIQTVFALMPELDKALMDNSSKGRWNVVNIILIRCWELIRDFLEHCEQKAEDETSAGDSTTMAEVLRQLLSKLAGTSEEGTGNSAPVSDPSSVPLPTASSTSAARSATAQQLAEAAGAGGNEDEESNGDEGESAAAAGDAEDNPPETPLPPKGGNGESPPTQNVSSEETDRIPLQQTDHIFDPLGGTTEHDDEYDGSGYENSGADIERLLDEMATRTVHKKLEKERTTELNDLAKAISYGDIHSGVNMVIHRMAEASDEQKEQYKEVTGPLLHISKQLQRSVTQQLQDKRRGGKQTNLLMGRRLNVHSLPRNDGRVFYKTSLPNEIPELAVAYLGDESGSMCGADRETYNRAAAIIIYDFCRALHIPVMVYGHTTGSNTVDLYSYAEFDAIDNDDCFRLMDISSRGANRDGAALRYVADQLSKRPEEIKLLFLTSDGQPADTGYSGTAAEEDLRGIKQEYTRKGVTLITAAIGNDKENIKRIYGDSFLDITDLTKLPVMLTEIIKKNIRV